MLLRSIIFHLAFYVSIAIQMIFWLPSFFFMPREEGWKVVRSWGYSCLWLHHHIIGTRFEFRGQENIPKHGGLIVAAKHQSTWETYTKLLFFADPSYILKRELMWAPMFGWYAWKMNVIPVNRGRKGEALRSMTENTEPQYHGGRHIVIYPEGTRRAAYAEPDYKYGIVHLYDAIGTRVLPVATNSGLFWPRNSIRLEQGTIIMEFLPVIEPGLSKSEFSAELQNRIETATAKLLEEGEADPEFKRSREK